MNKATGFQRRARDFAQRENWDAALAELRQAIAADASNPMLHNQMGDLCLRKEEVPQACEHFEKAIDLYAGLGLHANAVALCRKVMRLAPSRLEVRYRLARLRHEQGLQTETTAALADYLELLQGRREGDVRFLEERSREIVEHFPEAAPIGKILEKLEEARAFACAFEIVQRFAQRAADAGDDEAARRYTTKMRSLRVLVEKRGGVLPGKPEAPDAPPHREESASRPAPELSSRPGAESTSRPEPESAAFQIEDIRGTIARTVFGAELPPAEAPATAAPSAVAHQPGGAASRPELEEAEAGSAPRATALERSAAGSAERTEIEADEAGGTVYELDTEAEVPGSATVRSESDRSGGWSESGRSGLDADAPTPPSALGSRRAEAGDVAGPDAARDSMADEAAGIEYELPETSFDEIAGLFGGGAPSTADVGTPECTEIPAAADLAPAPPGPAWERDELPAASVPPDSFGASAFALGAASATPAHEPPAWPEPAAATTGASAFELPEPELPSPHVPGVLRESVWVPDDTSDFAGPQPRGGGSTHELSEVIDTFRKQMALALGDDAAARYDLGVAYYEMGLYDEALAEFEAARASAALRERSLEMMAACMAMQGRHGEILDLLAPVLHTQEDPRLGLGLRFSMGVACEALGRRGEARRYFEAVAQIDSSYRDVRARLQRI